MDVLSALAEIAINSPKNNIPTNAIKILNTFPKNVMGVISPYPTVRPVINTK